MLDSAVMPSRWFGLPGWGMPGGLPRAKRASTFRREQEAVFVPDIVEEIAEMIAEVGFALGDVNAGEECSEAIFKAFDIVAGDFFLEVCLIEGLDERDGACVHENFFRKPCKYTAPILISKELRMLFCRTSAVSN